jgi:GntR family transcriptional regulator, transcriptional repressor for pyruvate dehydrogenase complex
MTLRRSYCHLRRCHAYAKATRLAGLPACLMDKRFDQLQALPLFSDKPDRTMEAVFSRIEHSRTADEVVAQIESLILEGVLRAGDRLPGERDMARRFDISRPILRDALKTLEARRLLATRHGGGTYVADVIGELFATPVMELIVTHPKAVTDYFEYRREIEGIASAYAARRATADDKALLDQILKRMEKAHIAADPDEESAIDVEFHNAVGECAHNIILLHTLRSCYRLLSSGVFQARGMIYHLQGVREALFEQHRAIHSAILRGDAQEARSAAATHIDFVSAAMTEAERAGDWQRISRLRLTHRSQDGNGKRIRANVA